MKSNDEWLVKWNAENEARRAKQLDVSDLAGRTIARVELVKGRLTLIFEDGGSCSFEGAGNYDKITEDLDAEVVRVVGVEDE